MPIIYLSTNLSLVVLKKNYYRKFRNTNVCFVNFKDLSLIDDQCKLKLSVTIIQTKNKTTKCYVTLFLANNTKVGIKHLTCVKNGNNFVTGALSRCCLLI